MGFNKKKKLKLEEKAVLVDKFVENLAANVFVADKNGDVIFANQNSANTYQCSLDELFDFNAFTMQENGYTDRPPAVMEVLETKQDVKRFIKTGRDVGMIITCKPVFGEDGEVEYAVATSYKEEDFLSLLESVDQQKRQLEKTVSYLNRIGQDSFFIASVNEKMRKMYDLAQKSASMDSAIMIYGASGTGKEVLANYIHSISDRKDKPFIPVNCAAIPSELMESEFFGYEKGSFTGANESGKMGLFEAASDGTLFLDEIGELTLPMQSKLLRVLESGEYKRIGSNEISKTNARIIGATNKDLLQLVQDGGFRKDLYYRLNVIPLHLPPLCERKEDIMPLAYSFLKKYNNKMGTKKVFSEDVCNFMQNYSWPGNIRELRNFIERLMVVSTGPILNLSKEYLSLFDTEELGQDLDVDGSGAGGAGSANSGQGSVAVQGSGTGSASSVATIEIDYSLPYKEALHRFEQEYTGHVLKQCGGNISKAAKALHMQRSSLYNILNRAQNSEEQNSEARDSEA
jgi:transcriptional regulator with PAS, ATPase and Fis domain